MSSHPMDPRSLLRDLPAVHEVLEWPELLKEDGGQKPRWALRKAVQSVLERWRASLLLGRHVAAPSRACLAAEILEELPRVLQPSLRPVVNATGVVLHTNLGRAPLAPEALQAVQEIGRGYSNLELELETGKRGSRYRHVLSLLCELTGAESALVVNNNAAAVFLALRTLARGREVIVSRGELVEIGGSFRIPDILRESDAVLVEVGTTNRTHLADYERAVTSSTGLLLKVHPSNYRVLGFHREVHLEDLVALGRRFSIPVMQDLGSGCLVDLAASGVGDEPTVQSVVRTGVDLVTFSGDKLLGGPQAGLLVGKQAILETIQKHPLNRAVRIDKLTLAALEATLVLYRDPRTALDRVPALALLSRNPQTLKKKAARLARALRGLLPDGFDVRLRAVSARAGGGSLPLEDLPGSAVAIRCSRMGAEEILSRLRGMPVPVIARIERDEVLLDPRTLLAGEDALVLAAFRRLAEHPSKEEQP